MSAKLSFKAPRRTAPYDPESGDLANFDIPLPPTTITIGMPKDPPQEIVTAAREMERQQFLVRALPLLIQLGQMSVVDLSRVVQEEAFELFRFTQGLVRRAREELDPEFMTKFKVVSDRSVNAGAQSLVRLKYLGVENIEEILAHLPDYQILPPEKQGLIRQLFSKMFGLGGR